MPMTIGWATEELTNYESKASTLVQQGLAAECRTSTPQNSAPGMCILYTRFLGSW